MAGSVCVYHIVVSDWMMFTLIHVKLNKILKCIFTYSYSIRFDYTLREFNYVLMGKFCFRLIVHSSFSWQHKISQLLQQFPAGIYCLCQRGGRLTTSQINWSHQLFPQSWLMTLVPLCLLLKGKRLQKFFLDLFSLVWSFIWCMKYAQCTSDTPVTSRTGFTCVLTALNKASLLCQEKWCNWLINHQFWLVSNEMTVKHPKTPTPFSSLQ